ncbi:hypothetical protein GCM10010433_25490 [Streptomyces pulveraceus]
MAETGQVKSPGVVLSECRFPLRRVEVTLLAEGKLPINRGSAGVRAFEDLCELAGPGPVAGKEELAVLTSWLAAENRRNPERRDSQSLARPVRASLGVQASRSSTNRTISSRP